jgi:hypothetical protein
MKTVEREGFYKVKDIVSALAGMFDEDQKWLNTRWCGRALKRLGLVEDKRRVGSGVEVYLKPEKVKDAAERLGCIVTSTTQNPQTTQTTLTQENMKCVFEALAEASKERGTATTQEVALEAKLPLDTVKSVLEALQREGKAYSPYPEWWKLV